VALAERRSRKSLEEPSLASRICVINRPDGVSNGRIACCRCGCSCIVVVAARHASGLAWIAVLMCLAACVPLGTPVVSERAPAQAITGDVFLVRKGDTLYSIAWRAGKDYKKLAQLNGISAPFVIYPGQRLRLVAPPATKKAPKAPPSPSVAAPSRTVRISDSVAKSAATAPTPSAPSKVMPTGQGQSKPKATSKRNANVTKSAAKKVVAPSKSGALAWVRPIKQNPSVNFGNGSKGWDYQVNRKIRMRTASGGAGCLRRQRVLRGTSA